jgi:hypothetical protein
MKIIDEASYKIVLYILDIQCNYKQVQQKIKFSFFRLNLFFLQRIYHF